MFAHLSKLELAGWLLFSSAVLVMVSLIIGCHNNKKEETSATGQEVIVAPTRTQSARSQLPETPRHPTATQAVEGHSSAEPSEKLSTRPPSQEKKPANNQPDKLTPYEHYLKGLTYRNQGEYDKATAEFEKVIRARPQFWKAYVNLARTRLKQGKPSEAVEWCNKALKIQPKAADVYNVRGLGYLDQGLYPQATADFQRAISLNPKAAWPHNNLGLINLRMGHLDEALAQFKEAVKLSPKTALMHNNLGAALETKKRFAEAKAEYEIAVKLNPNYTKAKKNLERVSKWVKPEPPSVVYQSESDTIKAGNR